MKYFTPLFLLFSACALLPDRVYVELSENPIQYNRPWLGEEDEYAFTVGFEKSLQPTDVRIVGQSEHPWDFSETLGFTTPYKEPIPLYTKDPEVAEDISYIKDRIEGLAQQWDTVNTTILGGGGLGTLILLILGVRSYKKRRNPTEVE